ncbi:MAG: hypothetical protein JO199_03275, partial [Candidatus Eremiobacteraeota bacterium]|nr:hypothetical protein [Candidatus Eremiobacteraeota bacterium]
GAGGIGKTRLSIEVGHRLLDTHRDGVWFVDLSTASDASTVPLLVASSAGVALADSSDAADALLEALRPLQTLLIFDNCEHLLDGIAPLVEFLTRSCLDLHVLATSREPLGLNGESIYRLGPLSEDDATELFAERARAVDRDFAPQPDDLTVIRAICKRLEGIALALEMAAAQAHAMPLTEILVQIDRSILSLSGARRTGAARQRTLRATIGWSYELLPDHERVMLCRMGIFSGACSMTAVSSICATNTDARSDAIDSIVRLVEKSLVQCEGSASKRRYRLLNATKAFGRELLEEGGEVAMMERRRAEYFLGLAERAQKRQDAAEYGAFHESVGADYAEYRASLQWALAERNDVALGARLVTSLTNYWEERGLWREGRLWCENVLALDEDAIPLELRAAAHLGLTAHLYVAGEYELMAEAARDAEAAYARIGDARGEMRARYLRALGAQYAESFEAAEALYAACLATSRAIGDRAMESSALCNLAWVATISRCSYDEAEELYAQAAEIDRARATSHVLPLLLGDWSQTAAYEGAYDRAEVLASESLQLLRAVGDEMRVIEQLVRIGSYRTRGGRPEAAFEPLSEALERLRANAHPLYVSALIDACAELAIARGRGEVAALLLGFNSAWRAEKRLPHHAPERSRTANSIAAAREHIGERFERAWKRGTQASLRTALERCGEVLASEAAYAVGGS